MSVLSMRSHNTCNSKWKEGKTDRQLRDTHVTRTRTTLIISVLEIKYFSGVIKLVKLVYLRHFFYNDGFIFKIAD